jgi:hypothetical protein
MLYLFDTTLRSTVSVIYINAAFCRTPYFGCWRNLGVYDTFGKQSGFAHPQMYELFDLAKDPYEV